jgi:hypothetical protein
LAEDPLLLRNIKDAGSKTSKYRFFGGRTDYSGKKPDLAAWKEGLLEVANRSRYDSSRKLKMLSRSSVFSGVGDNYPLFTRRKRGGIAPLYVSVASCQKGRSLILCYSTSSCELFQKDRVIRWFRKEEYFSIRLLIE